MIKKRFFLILIFVFSLFLVGCEEDLIPPTLTVHVPEQISENSDVLDDLCVVSVPWAPEGDLIVELNVAPEQTGRLTVQGYTVIFGEEEFTYGLFDIWPIDNELVDGNVTLTIIANAEGYLPGSDTITIIDDETVDNGG